MNRQPLLTIIAFAMIFLASCKNSKTNLLIPNDASLVVHINGASLTSKLDWKEIKQSDWFKEIYNNNHDSVTSQLLDDPGKSGIDIKSGFAFFMKKQGEGNYLAFEGNLRDQAAFEALVKKLHHNVETRVDGEIKFINPDSSSVITWSNNRFIYLMNVPGFNMLRDPGFVNYTRYTPDSLRLFTRNLYSLKSADNIESNDHFSSLIKEDGDLHFWMDMGQYYSSIAGGAMSMFKATSLLEGNVTTFTLNFDDGKVAMKYKQYFGKEIAAIFDKYDFKDADQSMLKRISSNNVTGVMVSNFPPAIWKDILKASGLDGMANAGLGKINFSLDELVQAIKGPMLFSVSDLVINKVKGSIDTTFVRSEPDLKIMFAAAVNNKPSFDKLLNNLHSIDSSLFSRVNYKINNDWFVMSNSAPLVDGFMAGGNNNMPFADKITGHNFGMYVDIQKILNAIQPGLTDSAMKASMDASIKIWKDIVITGGDYKNGVSSGEMVINLMDKSTNSIKQFNQYARDLYQAHKLRHTPQYFGMDSTQVMVTPPISDSIYTVR